MIRSSEFFQRGFLEWEKQGRVYRFDKDILPTKFKDATLCKSELALIKEVRLKGGTLHFSDGTTVSLPWSTSDESAIADALFVHCSAGAFNYSKQTKKPPPVFSRHRISIQDVYGTPGLCFVGSVIGRLESLGPKLTWNSEAIMCRVKCMCESVKSMLGESGVFEGRVLTNF